MACSSPFSLLSEPILLDKLSLDVLFVHVLEVCKFDVKPLLCLLHLLGRWYYIELRRGHWSINILRCRLWVWRNAVLEGQNTSGRTFSLRVLSFWSRWLYLQFLSRFHSVTHRVQYKLSGWRTELFRYPWHLFTRKLAWTNRSNRHFLIRLSYLSLNFLFSYKLDWIAKQYVFGFLWFRQNKLRLSIRRLNHFRSKIPLEGWRLGWKLWAPLRLTCCRHWAHLDSEWNWCI